MASFDMIVLGVGGVGSAALYHAARRGLRVLGIDRFPPGHDRGSSHGESRVIRTAYFEHPDYVPLLRRAYTLWQELETDARQTLFHRVGLLQAGPPDGIVIPGVLNSAREHHLAVESLSASDAERRFPGFRIPAELSAVFEADAGYLLVEDCVRAHAALAQRHGAQLALGESVLSWSANSAGVQVVTSRATYSAARLIIAAGAWSSALLGALGIPLRVLRKHLYWFATRGACYSHAARCPAYLYELPQGVFYGLPEVAAPAVKVGEHTGGALVQDPLTDPRALDPSDLARVAEFVAQCLPDVSHPPLRHAVCYYTMSPDENFLVDRSPEHEAVVFAAGLSGHGFKFTSVLGEALVDLAQHGRSSLPLEFLKPNRLPTSH